MASINPTATAAIPLTHEGGRGELHVTAFEQLQRSVMNCMLWEQEYYEDGVSIADRITKLAATVPYQQVVDLAVKVRTEGKLRHVPLLLLCSLLPRQEWRKDGTLTSPANAIAKVISRPDEITELVAIYWRAGKRPLSAQLKRGLGEAFRKFDAFSLGRYKQTSKKLKLRDVMKLVRPKPSSPEQSELWRQLVKDELPTPETWETELSAGKDKLETWTRLINEGKIGYLALLRNLRNMEAVGVQHSLIKQALLARKGGADKVLPWRFVAAARAAPSLAETLDESLLQTIKDLPELPGRTLVLVDVSGSMEAKLSAKSDMTRMDAAAALAGLIRSAEGVVVYSFSTTVVQVQHRTGLSMMDPIVNSQGHGGTALAKAIADTQSKVKHDRLIVITDEQSDAETLPEPVAKHCYVINVASATNGIQIGKSVRISGFSENVIRWIHAYESQQ